MTTWNWTADDTPTDLQGFDVVPSRRFGGGDSEVEEVLPCRQRGEPLDTPRTPVYLLKSYARDAIAERLSYLCAHELGIPYQTVRWVRYPEPVGRVRRARNRGGLDPIGPQVVVGFVDGALLVRDVDLSGHTCHVRDGRAEQVLPAHNVEDYYRILALGVFADDIEAGSMLRSNDGWIFGHDLTLGFGLTDLRMAFPEELRVLLRGLKAAGPEMQLPQDDLGPLRRRLELYTFADDPAGRRLFNETLHRLANAQTLPQLLADDLQQAPAPTANRQAEPVAQWTKQRQAALTQVLAEIDAVP